MSTSKRLTLFCVLSLLSFLLEPLQAYGDSPLSGLKMDNSLYPRGAKVFAVKENSLASRSGVQANDVITSIEGYTVNSIDDFARVSQGLKDKESVLLTVNRGGVILEVTLSKKSVVEQAKPETRVQAEPPPKQAEVKTVQKGFKNPVVPNATGVTYRHGQYPSEGNNTHPGIDIVADCHSPIYAFADGEVADIIKDDEKDPHYQFLGYYALIKHLEPINGRDTYSTYLHMLEPPTVKKGQKVKAGDVLGKVGDTGNAKGCHVHFELRHFPDRFLSDKGWNYPLNIYGKGDQRNEKRFLDNWEDPEIYFSKYPGGIVSQEKKPQGETKIAKRERIESQIVSSSSCLPKTNSGFVQYEGNGWWWVFNDPETGVRFAADGGLHGLNVLGEVPNSIDLTDHKVATELLFRGKDIALYQASFIESGRIWVGLYAGSLTSRDQNYDVIGFFDGRVKAEQFAGARELKVNYGTIFVRGFDDLKSYSNDIAIKKAVEKVAVIAKQMKELAYKTVSRRISDFVNKYKIEAIVKPEVLYSNPFAYKGKNIAVKVAFKRMISENIGEFGEATQPLVVTNIPSGLFSSPQEDKYADIMAVRFVGIQERNLPHFKFLGSLGHEFETFLEQHKKEVEEFDKERDKLMALYNDELEKFSTGLTENEYFSFHLDVDMKLGLLELPTMYMESGITSIIEEVLQKKAK